MSERVLEAWEEAKQANPSTPGITPEGLPSMGKTNESLIPEDAAERKTYAMRLIAQRCLYGVDKNPLAVEMAKLSLWLLTVAKDKPFEFLDHSIRHGDSLVGLHNIDQLRHYSLKPEAEDAVLFKGPLDGAVDEAINLRLKLEDLPANTVEDVERQEKLLKEANEKIVRLRCAADLLVAAEFWGGNAKDKLERVRHNAVRSGYYIEKGPTEEFEQVAAKDRQGQSMFHWCLEFPEVIVKRGGFDAFVGNPPFMGGKKISGRFNSSYREFLVEYIADGTKGNADICAFFFLRAGSLLSTYGRFGLVATNTIAQGDTCAVGLRQLINCGFIIDRAVSSCKWPGEAVIEVSHVWTQRSGWKGKSVLDGRDITSITASLTSSLGITCNPLKLSANLKRAFQGSVVLGVGFVLSPTEAKELLDANSKHCDVVFPYLNGEDLNTRYDQNPSRWVINFFDWPLDKDSSNRGYLGPVAADYPQCLSIIRDRVKPQRDLLGLKNDATAKGYAKTWWQYGRRGVDLYETLGDAKRVLVCSEVTKYLAFCFVSSNCVFSANLDAFPGIDEWHFCVLQSTIHDAWARTYSSNLRVDLKYSPGNAFETFPFPLMHESLEEIGDNYHRHRSDIMNSRREGITKTYNRFHLSSEASADIVKLRELHVEMDQAVAAAYGWTDLNLDHGFHETKQGIRYTISEPARKEVLQRLLKLNHERYAEEVKQGLHDKKKGSAKKATPKKKANCKQTKDGATLFDQVEEDNE